MTASSSKRWAAFFALVFLAGGCRVEGRIQTGRPVSMNPCNLVGLERAQDVLGASLYQQLDVRLSSEGPAEFGPCYYQTKSLGDSPELAVRLDKETRADTKENFSSGEFKPLKGLGRDARYLYINDEDPLDATRLLALSSQGAKLTLILSMVNADEKSLLTKARSLATPALARMEKLFPGSEKPPREEPPIPICSTVGSEAMAEIYRTFWSLPPGKSLLLAEAEFFGGPESVGSGPVGGGWVCDADIAPHDSEVYHPHVGWWVSKGIAPAEPLPGSAQVSRLGAAAFSRMVDEGWYYGGKSLMLTVFSKEGRHFEVEVLIDEVVNESVAKSVATAVAQKILSQLP